MRKTAEELGVTENFEEQEREPDAEPIDTDDTDALRDEAEAAGLPFAPPIEHRPSDRNNPYVTEEMQGMEMIPQVIGPPPYGSPDPNTSAGRLLPIKDHPLAAHRLPEDHPSAISEDYGRDVQGSTHPASAVSHPITAEIQDNPQPDSDVDATGSARDLARAENVNLHDVDGTGTNGRVTKGDVQDYIDRREGEENESDEE